MDEDFREAARDFLPAGEAGVRPATRMASHRGLAHACSPVAAGCGTVAAGPDCAGDYTGVRTLSRPSPTTSAFPVGRHQTACARASNPGL